MEELRHIPFGLAEKQRLLRGLMNVRPPVPVNEDFLRVQDAYLEERLTERGVTSLKDLKPVRPGLHLWKGDITTLAVDAIVNAANSQMLGRFAPCHGCIDNAIHTYAGVQLRMECAGIMARQNREESMGSAKITKSYNLPCRYVLHTVGPIIGGAVTKADKEVLASCCRTCLELAAETGLGSIAFCCISTGEFHFPNELAAEIAIQTVQTWQRQNPEKIWEEYWAYWSRYIYINRYLDAPKPVYQELLKLVQDKDCFVLTTNVDHCFQKAGFDKRRLFYTQGD